MNSILKKDIENNKYMIFGLLIISWFISFIINLIYTIYPDGLGNKDKRIYHNQKLKKIKTHNHNCKGTYNSMISKFMALGLVFILFFFLIIQLLLNNKFEGNNKNFLAILVIFSLIMILSIGYVILEINKYKEHILVFKNNGYILNCMGWFLQVILGITLIYFYDNVFNVKLFEGTENKKWDYLLKFLDVVLFFGTIYLHYLIHKMKNTFTDEELCTNLNY